MKRLGHEDTITNQTLLQLVSLVCKGSCITHYTAHVLSVKLIRSE